MFYDKYNNILGFGKNSTFEWIFENIVIFVGSGYSNLLIILILLKYNLYEIYEIFEFIYKNCYHSKIKYFQIVKKNIYLSI